MKVSIIIPAYNEEKNLEATIMAILNQSYKDFELIVVDNGSTDSTADIAMSFGNKLTLLHESRKGTQWARECGRQKARGEIIANVDADCVPSPDWLHNGLSLMQSEKCVALGGPYDYYDAGPLLRVVALSMQKTSYVFLNWFLQKIGKGAVLIGGNVLLRSDALQKAGGYNTDLTFYGDDTDTAKRMARIGKVTFSGTFVMKTSARRLKNQGILNTIFHYIFHFVKVIVTKI
jgi:glycosyltransferase involved in cell wall biosynthesis